MVPGAAGSAVEGAAPEALEKVKPAAVENTVPLPRYVPHAPLLVDAPEAPQQVHAHDLLLLLLLLLLTRITRQRRWRIIFADTGALGIVLFPLRRLLSLIIINIILCRRRRLLLLVRVPVEPPPLVLDVPWPQRRVAPLPAAPALATAAAAECVDRREGLVARPGRHGGGDFAPEHRRAAGPARRGVGAEQGCRLARRPVAGDQHQVLLQQRERQEWPRRRHGRWRRRLVVVVVVLLLLLLLLRRT